MTIARAFVVACVSLAVLVLALSDDNVVSTEACYQAIHEVEEGCKKELRACDERAYQNYNRGWSNAAMNTCP